MSFRLLIFDFDGTIANTLEVAVQIVNELGEEFGFPTISENEFVDLKNKSMSELMRMSGISWMQLPLLVKRARDRFKHHLEQVHPVPGMLEVLLTLKEKGYPMGILTSNTEDSVRAFLDQFDINVFDFIHAPDSIFGKAKVLKDLRKQYKAKGSELLMIGDEARDIEAAIKARVKSVAVGWGFNGEELLSRLEPTYIIHHPSELLGLVGEPIRP